MPQGACRDHSALQIPCGYLHCERYFKSQAGRKKHWNASHPTFKSAPVEDEPEEPHNNFPADHDDFPTDSFDAGQALDEPDNLEMKFWGPGDKLYCNYHPKLNGRPCDAAGQFLEDGAPPMPPLSKSPDDWTPYWDRVEFETAEFLYTRNQMSAGDINVLLDLWATTLLKHNNKPPFADCHDLYKTIDSTPVGNVKWQSFQVKYTGEKPAYNVPPWMNESHDVWYRDPHEVIRNMLGNTDYAAEMDYQPYCEFLTDNDKRQWQDFMSSDWAWNQADKISNDPDTTGSTFVPVILGSDKTTVSVATGANDYYPLYVSIGNIRNNVQRAHCDAVAIIGFLAMPKTMKEHASCPKYRKYRRQLFHLSISKILDNLRPGITKPEVVRFGDRHYRHVIYGLEPYIADYEEQVLLVCIVCSWCPRCMSHHKDLDSESLHRNCDHTEALVEELSSTDLWDEYGIISDLVPFTNDFARADIHELIAPDLLHQLIKGTFKDHLVEWVGKYLHLVHGKKGAEKIQDDIDRSSGQLIIALVASFSGLRHFLQGRGFKQWTSDDSKALMKVYLPAIEGYVPTDMVCTFRAFLEFCYLVRHNIITESTLTKHIKAVKEPWRRSSRYKALGQMLVTNQRLDKLAASCIDFKSCGMLNGTCLSETLGALKRKRARTVPDLCTELAIPHLYNLLCQFLFEQVNPDDECSPSDVPLARCPQFNGKIQVFNSASSTFYAPSDRSGIGGMHWEHIRSCPLWRKEAPCYDCVFVNTDAGVEGMGGMDIARVICFFSFMFEAVLYPCAVVHWFNKVNDRPDEDTGMWIVQPSYDIAHLPSIGIVHVDSIYRTAHLIPIYGTHAIPYDLKYYDSYDAF
ncbi:hypothetical protein F4604DRAFT_1878722 [Suillus subluteus]|nr:hypothetical protein F4604DRAFT_1878722 [Suillus subluteus]